MKTIALILTGLFLLGEGVSSLQGNTSRFLEETYVSSEFRSLRTFRQKKRHRRRRKIQKTRRRVNRRLAAQRKLIAQKKAEIAQKKAEKKRNVAHRALASIRAEALLRASLNGWILYDSQEKWRRAHPSVEVIDHRGGKKVFGISPKRLLDVKRYPRIKLEEYEFVLSWERPRLKDGKFRGMSYKVILHIQDKLGKRYVKTHIYHVNLRERKWKISVSLPKKPKKSKKSKIPKKID